MNLNQIKLSKQHLISIIAIIILCVVGGVTLILSMYTIGENEQAVVTTFGMPQTVKTSGLHMKIPFVQKVEKIDTTIKGFAIGFDSKTNESIERESLMITSDYNFVNVDFYVEYKVSDPIKALYNTVDPVLILKNLAQSFIRDTIGMYKVDDVITSGKSAIQAEIKTKIMERLEKDDIGIQLVNITIQDAEPPTDTIIDAFKAVETAKQGKETALNNANKYKNEKIPEAEASADKILKEAESTKQSRVNEANGQASRFNSLYAEYAKFPLITKQRMFYETMQDILPELKIIIDSSDGGVDKVLPLEEFASIVNEPATEKE